MSEAIRFEPRLLAGPDPSTGPESYRAHSRRLGALPPVAGLIEALERSGIRGRGGAGFPVGSKWRSIASRAGGSAVVLANGCEGEPLSRKDRLLMEARPQLVLDGAFLARKALAADRVLLMVAADHEDAQAALRGALAERPEPERASVQLIIAPTRYVTGESSAMTNLVNTGVSVPGHVPPRPHERGVDGLPTLVQNVESLAQVALVARGQRAGSRLATVHAGGRQAVREVEEGIPLGDLLEAEGVSLAEVRAVLLGGYFGSWVPALEAWSLPLDQGALKERGLSLGSGVVAALPIEGCVVCETARIMGYLAGESSAQCGPCFYGLRAIAGACYRVSGGLAEEGELERLRRWGREVRGRGACHHPDGAAGLLASALDRFGADFEGHRRHRPQAGLA